MIDTQNCYLHSTSWETIHQDIETKANVGFSLSSTQSHNILIALRVNHNQNRPLSQAACSATGSLCYRPRSKGLLYLRSSLDTKTCGSHNGTL